MKILSKPRLKLIIALIMLILLGCESKPNERFTIERSYNYTIRASIGGSFFSDNGSTHFELKPKFLRRRKFRHLPAKPGAIMYAYCLTSKHRFNRQLKRDEVVSGDTTEVAVTKAQADSLFTLAKAVFETVSLSNIDTVYAEPPINSFQTDDTSGIMQFEGKYGNIEIEIGPLHSSKNRQALPFLALWDGFRRLFLVKSEQKMK
ncbi:hypothetical protein FY528_18745 [Hymenobacter lutimineralis]|uniref:Uncharacterized protein n=1 Tax=Hymenobacter lutimineralis TaxID=2606448 RepID=A0A5D6UTM6_9BACT|nr:hypothetical protein [Hymenobacter lutimineralis]TYZ06278.1 hypothetical protein FY528_18745 [Hymenobacter lutimineralis]